MSKNRVAAYITAYQDGAAVRKCIQAISEQTYKVSAVFIVDNSPVSLLENTDGLILVSHHPDNIGVGAGLMLGIEWAIEQSYEFLWVFDQDSVPAPNCLETLLKTYDRLFQDCHLGIIAPTSIDLRTQKVVEGADFKGDRFVGCQHNSQVQYYSCDAPITSGSLISIAVAKTIPPPQADLFIDGVDFEYGMRLKQKGFQNLIVSEAILYHQFGDPIKVKFLQKERLFQKYSALRYYYICRNHTYLETRYAQGWYYRLTCCLWRAKFTSITIILILLYEDREKLLKTWACLIGTLHGLQGKLGKTW